MKRSFLRRKPPKDPVTPEMYRMVMNRDRECVAPQLDPFQSGTCSGRLTLDHVRDFAMMGKRAPSDMRHLVVLCEEHHLYSGWATSHRGILREYLRFYERRPDDIEP